MRFLRRNPGFALAAIATIALGVGVNTAVFSVVRAVLLDPLPFRDPNRLVQVWERHPALPTLQVSVPDFLDWRRSARSFESLPAYTFAGMNHITLLGQGDPVVLQGTMVTADLFPALGMRMLAGRAFSAEDEQAKKPVTLLSEALWRRKFGADPGIVGRAIRLESQSMTVVGIVAGPSAFPEWADLWLPFSFLEPELWQTRKYHPLEVIGRLRRGVTPAQAQAEMGALAARLEAAYPATNGHIGAEVIPLATQETGAVRPLLLMCWAAVGLVLLIACANLAHLLLARNASRAREIAIRAAVGAGRGRLARHLLSESLVLALLGGGAGALLAGVCLPLLRRMAEGRLPRLEGVTFDAGLFAFAMAISAACGLLFGVPACLRATRPDLHALLKNSPAGGTWRTGWGSLLIAGEVALALVVLAGASLLLRSFEKVLRQDPGFRSDRVLAVPVSLSNSRYDWERAERLFENVLKPRIRTLPGVLDVAATNYLPLSMRPTEHSRWATRFGVPGKLYPDGSFPVAQMRFVTPNYFAVMGIPLLRGRLLSEQDRGTTHHVISEALARRYFPGQDPVGRKLLMGVVSPHPEEEDIVGVVGDTRDLAVDAGAPPTMYSMSVPLGLNLLVKTAGDPRAAAPAVLEAIRAADPEAPAGHVETLEQAVAGSLAARRFALLLAGTFAGLAALLTAIGIYGVVAYSVARRTREFGIRLALGANRGRLCGMVLREGLARAALGLAAGLVLSRLFAPLIQSLLYELAPADPLSIAAATGFLLLLCCGSALAPVWRAARGEPGDALRES